MYSFEKLKQKEAEFEAAIKRKSDVLLLRESPKENITWPYKYKVRSAESHYSTTTSAKRSRTLYTKVPMNKTTELKSENTASSKPNDAFCQTNYELDEYVSQLLSKGTKHADQTKVESVQTLSVDLLDRMFASLADTPKLDSENQPIGWEYVVGKMLHVGLPQVVIDRVVKRMEQTIVKPSPVIPAMNVTRLLLSDLTITTAEVEMQEEIKKIAAERERFESKEGDEPFEDSIKWLIDLDKKDQYLKDKEIEEIHLDYTNVL
ncbi:hypothetical protein BD770DRAFT_444309 [Pilaira anomala]|nr:hypothetical protein BD770DRAFT_444309 [Pilaira anomala]